MVKGTMAILKAKLKVIFSIISIFLKNKCVIINPGKNNTNIDPKTILKLSKNVNFVNDNIKDIIRRVIIVFVIFFVWLFILKVMVCFYLYISIVSFNP